MFVLDREAAVAYLTGDLLAELKLTPDQALEVGRANLARTFGRDVVRSAVGSRNINVIKSCDSFDAARLLLVPGYLDAGESLVALIPDRDTLVLTAAPADGDWAGLRKLARAAAGDPLWAEPLIVTSDGHRQGRLAGSRAQLREGAPGAPAALKPACPGADISGHTLSLVTQQRGTAWFWR